MVASTRLTPDATGVTNTGVTNTGVTNTGVTNTGVTNTGAINTGAINTGAINTGAINTGAINTGAIKPRGADMSSIVVRQVPTGLAAGMMMALTVIGPARAEPIGGPIAYRNPTHGFSLRIPAEVSVADRLANIADGGIWRSPDGTVRLVAVAAANESGESLSSYRSFVMRETYKDAVFDYAPVRKSWFVLSGTQGDRMFYERITFVCGGRYIHGWQLVYPVAERVQYDRIVEEIHRSYRAGPRPEGC